MGEFIGFVDFDDWLELIMYEVFFNFFKNNDVDIFMIVSIMEYFDG